MNFKQYLYRESWTLTDRSMNQFKHWARIVKSDSRFLEITPREAEQLAKQDNSYERVIEKFRTENAVDESFPDHALWQHAYYDYLYANQGIILAQVDPCKLLELRTLRVTQPTLRSSDAIELSGEKDFTQENSDPNLPLVLVSPAGIKVKDGNHRLYAACQHRMDAYAAVAYWKQYDAVSEAVKKIIMDVK